MDVEGVDVFGESLFEFGTGDDLAAESDLDEHAFVVLADFLRGVDGVAEQWAFGRDGRVVEVDRHGASVGEAARSVE